MILRILGADFSSANIGTLSTYIISKSIGSGASFDIPNFVDKNSSVNWVITLNEGYTFGTYSVTMGGAEVTPTVVDNVMTISIAEVTGNVRIVVATVNENGEEDEPTIPDTPTPDVPTSMGTLYERKTFSTNGAQAYNITSTFKDDENYFCYDKVPVTPNTTYRIQYGRAMYLLASDYSTISPNWVTESSMRPNLSKDNEDYTFTTPDNCVYISIAFRYDEVQPDDVVIQRLGGVQITVVKEELLSEISGEFLDGKGLSSNDYILTDNTETFVYKDIPVTAGTMYKIPYGRNTWFLDSNKSKKYKVNLRTDADDYTFIPEDGVAYITTSGSKTDISASEMKLITLKKETVNN